MAIPLDGTVEKSVANMTDELWDILSLMGKECGKGDGWQVTQMRYATDLRLRTNQLSHHRLHQFRAVSV